MSIVRIHIERVGKPKRVFTETLVRDNGLRLDTQNEISHEAGLAFSKGWQQHGLLAPGQVIRGVRKHHFYREWFGVMELFDINGALLGRYCDVLTPLHQINGEYYMLDLLLDLWIWPDGRWEELDWDEFEDANQAGLLTADMYQQAQFTLHRMVSLTRQGTFPGSYLST